MFLHPDFMAPLMGITAAVGLLTIAALALALLGYCAVLRAEHRRHADWDAETARIERAERLALNPWDGLDDDEEISP